MGVFSGAGVSTQPRAHSARVGLIVGQLRRLKSAIGSIVSAIQIISSVGETDLLIADTASAVLIHWFVHRFDSNVKMAISHALTL
jgi:hypothetical protein